MAHPLAGQLPEQHQLVNVAELISDYYIKQPNHLIPEQKVSFGTSGHRGSALHSSFNEHHIKAVTQAVCDYRQQQEINGPLFIGKDTHALSEPAYRTALSVLLANGVKVVTQHDHGITPTPVISFLILNHNRQSDDAELADGIVITPSHNPPEDGGFKYNDVTGGPAQQDATNWIEHRANALMSAGLVDVKAISWPDVCTHDSLMFCDFRDDYIQQLSDVVDLKAIANAGINIGVDPLGGSGIWYWERIAKEFGLSITLVNKTLDPTFRFMPLDKDGKIRMDCSSPWAMSSLLAMKAEYDISIGNDPDYDRHGIVTPDGGLMNPNQFLVVAIHYLFNHRPEWKTSVGIGKTLVSSSMIDKVAASLGREVYEVPVGFKWFVDKLHNGEIGFAGEESAGATFIRKNGQAWTTDKDGFVMGLLAAEILAVTGKNPHQYYQALEAEFGESVYQRLDAPAEETQRKRLKQVDVASVCLPQLAGSDVQNIFSHAPGNQAAIGGLKVVTEHGWFAARPSGTENIYKIYLESFKGNEHLHEMARQAQQFVDDLMAD